MPEITEVEMPKIAEAEMLVNEFRNESIYETERNKPMVRLDTQKCQACILHVSEKLQNAEMPETENA